MKKVKLFLSICAICLSISVFCLGVYAAQTVTYTISGTISYTVEDVFAKINTIVFKVAEQTSAENLKTNVDQLAKLETKLTSSSSLATQSNSNKNYQYVESLEEFDTSTSTTENANRALTDIVFGKDSNNNEYLTYYIVVNVENLADRAIDAKLTDKTTSYTNLNIKSSLYYSNIGQNKSKNLVIAFSLIDKRIEISEFNLNYLVTVGYEVEQDQITDYTFEIITEPSGDTKGTARITNYRGTDSIVTTPSTVSLVQMPDHEGIYEFEAGIDFYNEINNPSGILYLCFFSKMSLERYNEQNVLIETVSNKTVTGATSLWQTLFGDDWSTILKNEDESVVKSAFQLLKNIKIDTTSFSFGEDIYKNSDGSLITDTWFNGTLTQLFLVKIQQLEYLNASYTLTKTSDGSQLTFETMQSDNFETNPYPVSLTVVSVPGDLIAYEGYDYVITEIYFGFCNNTDITSVTVSEGVEEIDFIFNNCANLVSVILPKSLLKIDSSTFSSCDSLVSVIFEDTANWYYTDYSSDYTGGTQIDVTNGTINANNLTCDTSRRWYKKTS